MSRAAVAGVRQQLIDNDDVAAIHFTRKELEVVRTALLDAHQGLGESSIVADRLVLFLDAILEPDDVQPDSDRTS